MIEAPAKDIITDTTVEYDDNDVGREWLFINELDPLDWEYSFASRFEDIGINNDCKLKNNTVVLVLSDPVETIHPTKGRMLVSQILAHTTMWVSTASLKPIERKPNQ